MSYGYANVWPHYGDGGGEIDFSGGNGGFSRGNSVFSGGNGDCFGGGVFHGSDAGDGGGNFGGGCSFNGGAIGDGIDRNHISPPRYPHTYMPVPPPPPRELMDLCDYPIENDSKHSTSILLKPVAYAAYVKPHPYQRRPVFPYSRPFRPKRLKLSDTVAKEQVAETNTDGTMAMFFGRDPNYPDELNALIHPLGCDLCKTSMNSSSSAKDHFESKQHDRKLIAWMNENVAAKGLTVPKIQRLNKDGPTGPDAFHCALCDLNLTSLMHANQHYAGRKHRLVAQKISKPSGTGYYNFEGKWVRTSKKTVARSDVNRTEDACAIAMEKVVDSGCEDYPAAEQTPPSNIPAIVDGTVAEVPTEIAIKKTPAGGLSSLDANPLACQMCNVIATSQSQLSMHLVGVKHRKKAKQASKEPGQSAVLSALPSEGPLAEPSESILSAINSPAPENGGPDLSMYRTPTGSYYCQICNTAMCHESALHQHLIGKKHLKKASELKA